MVILYNCVLIAFCSEVFLKCVTTIEAAVERVCVELREMCSQYSWLSDVWHFITAWEGNEKIASMTADKYEVFYVIDIA